MVSTNTFGEYFDDLFIHSEFNIRRHTFLYIVLIGFMSPLSLNREKVAPMDPTLPPIGKI